MKGDDGPPGRQIVIEPESRTKSTQSRVQILTWLLPRLAALSVHSSPGEMRKIVPISQGALEDSMKQHPYPALPGTERVLSKEARTEFTLLTTIVETRPDRQRLRV